MEEKECIKATGKQTLRTTDRCLMGVINMNVKY